MSLTGKIIHFPHMVTHVTHYRIMNVKRPSPEESRWKIFACEDFFFFFLLFIEYLLNHSDNVLKYAIYPANTPLAFCVHAIKRWKSMNLTYNPPCHSDDMLHVVPQGFDMLFAAPTFLKSACSSRHSIDRQRLGGYSQ